MTHRAGVFAAFQVSRAQVVVSHQEPVELLAQGQVDEGQLHHLEHVGRGAICARRAALGETTWPTAPDGLFARVDSPFAYWLRSTQRATTAGSNVSDTATPHSRVVPKHPKQ